MTTKPNAEAPDYFAAVRNKRMFEMTPAQQEDAHELWLREQIGHCDEWSQTHIRFLLDRIESMRRADSEELVRLRHEAKEWEDTASQEAIRRDKLSNELIAVEKELFRLRKQESVIRQIKNLVCGEARPNWDVSMETTGMRGRIADMCDSVLLSAQPKTEER